MIQQEPEDEQTTKVEAEVGGEDVGELKQALAEEKQKAESYLANWQRAQADFINYKRRSEQEKIEAGDSANAKFMLSLLPAIDDLEHALANIPPEAEGHGWVEGIKLIGRKLQTSLEASGLSPIKAVGEAFDPCFHEAVRQAKGKEGIVLEEVQKGYSFRGRLIRPSRVVVGSGEGVEEADRKEE